MATDYVTPGSELLRNSPWRPDAQRNCVAIALGFGIAGLILAFNWQWWPSNPMVRAISAKENWPFSPIIFGLGVAGTVHLLLGLFLRLHRGRGNVIEHERDLVDAIQEGRGLELVEDLDKPVGLLSRRLWLLKCRADAGDSDLKSVNERLAELDEAEHENFLRLSLIVCWLCPLFGFLGTIWGSRIAIASLAVGLMEENESMTQAALSGIGVSLDTTLIGITALIVVGTIRHWAGAQREAALNLVDSAAQAAIHDEEVRTSQQIVPVSTPVIVTPPEESNVILEARMSRLALEVYRGNPKRSHEFLEARVVEGLHWYGLDGPEHVCLSPEPHAMALITRHPSNSKLISRLFELRVGPGDGLFVHLNEVPLAQHTVQKAETHAGHLDFDARSGAMLLPLGNGPLGICFTRDFVQRPAEQGKPAQREPAPIQPIKNLQTASPKRAVLLRHEITSAARVAADAREGLVVINTIKPTNFAELDPTLSTPIKGWRIFAADSRSWKFLALSGDHTVAMCDASQPQLSMTGQFREEEPISLGFMSWHLQTIAYVCGGRIKTRPLYPDGPAQGGDRARDTRVDGAVRALGMIGSRGTHNRVVMLTDKKELWIEKEKAPLLTGCIAMSCSTDGRYVVAIDEDLGVRIYGYRPADC